MNSAVIVSGGSGSRFGGNVPKQFIKLQGEEILSFSVNTFLEHPNIDEVIIVCHPNWIDHVRSKYTRCKIVKGGEQRRDSCLNGLLSISNTALNVLIHDAARPFISKNIISNCLTALNTYEACAPIIPSIDSLVNINKGNASFLDRSQTFIVQTPQCFKKKLITDVLKSNISGTDEIGMLLKLHPKSKTTFVEGNLDNNKITTPMDLKYFS